MATQDKLIIFHQDSNFTEVKDIEEIKEGSTVFEFNEFETCSIKNQSKYKIEIECISCIVDKKNLNCKHNLLELRKDFEYLISSNDDHDEVSYLPGLYQMHIFKENENINAYFNVNYNKELGPTGLDNITALIDKFANGLSLDFFKKQSILTKRFDVDSEYFAYEFILFNEKKIIYSLNKIISSLNTNLHNEYRLENVMKHQNAKSLRMNLLRTKTDDKVYNLSKAASLNTIENIILKKELIVINHDLLNYYTSLLQNKQAKKAALNALNQEVDTLKAEIDSLEDGAYRRSLKSHLKSLLGRKDDLDNWLIKINEWIVAYDKVLKAIKLILVNSEFKEIDDKRLVMVNNAFSDPNYRYIAEIYNKLHLKHSRKIIYHNSSTKSSYLLFEIYGFIIIQNILKDLGFKQINHQDINFLNFASAMVFEYQSSKYLAKVRYDYYCPFYVDAKANQPVSINSFNCQPDYILEFYDLDGNFIDMLIIEMKYRRLQRIISTSKITSNEYAINDYYQLAYYLPNGEYNFEYPRNVYVIYPSFEEKFFKYHLGKYAGINASLDLEDSATYKKLKEEILSIL